MAADDDEDKLLPIVAPQNVQSILQARQQAEEALRRQSEWLRITLAKIGDAVISVDPEGRVTFMNAVAEKLTGWPQAEAVGLALPDVLQIVDEQSRRPVDNAALLALQQGPDMGLASQLLLIARDGTERPIDDRAAPIRDDAGNVAGAVLVFRDVSYRLEADAKQRRAHEAVEAERARLAEIFDLSPAYTAVLKGPDHIYERANARYYQFVGERELIGKPVREAIPEIVGTEYIDLLDRVFQTGEAFVGINMRLMLGRQRNGPLTERFVDFVYQPLRDSSGAVTGVLSHGIDLTDRKRAEEGQAYLAAIVESSDDAIVGKTLNGQILSWNAGTQRIFGYPADEAIGRPITLIIPPERQDEERMILDRIRRGERVEHFETIRVSKTGRRIDISLTVSPVRNREGQIVGVSKVARDITDRKQAEKALREADRRKEHFIAMLCTNCEIL